MALTMYKRGYKAHQINKIKNDLKKLYIFRI